MGTHAELAPSAAKMLRRMPPHVVAKLLAWVDDVRERGIDEVRKSPGFHDEPVKGKKRLGQRSIRLSLSYRAFYTETRNAGSSQLTIVVVEVNKHVY